MSERHIIFVANDNRLILEDFQDQKSGGFFPAAVVTVTLLNPDGTEVVGATWPLAMTFIPNTNASFDVTLPDTLSLNPNTEYTAVIDADGGPGFKAHWEMALNAIKRTHDDRNTIT